jgi:hypothetical protein
MSIGYSLSPAAGLIFGFCLESKDEADYSDASVNIRAMGRMGGPVLEWSRT